MMHTQPADQPSLFSPSNLATTVEIPAAPKLVPMAPHVAYSVFLEAFIRLTSRETYQRLSQPAEVQA